MPPTNLRRARRGALITFLMTAFSLAACGNDKGTNGNQEGLSGEAFIFLTDYQSATLARYQSSDTSVADVPLLSLHTDVALRSYSGLLYVIERFGRDAIRVIDPKTPSAPLANYSVGNGTNPQDIIVRDENTAYVLRLNSANVLVINPMTGDSIGAISLAAYADADGKPEMTGGVIEGGKLYVLVQLLDIFWQPTGPGKVVVIDTRTNQVASTVTLSIQNPLAIVDGEGALYIVGGPYGDPAHAGIDRVSIPDGAVTNVASGAALNGRPTAMEMNDDRNGRAWVLVAKDWPNASVYAVNLSSGTIADSLSGVVAPSAIARGAGNALLVSDRDMARPGLYLYDAVTGAKLRGPISTSLPPDAIAFIRR